MSAIKTELDTDGEDVTLGKLGLIHCDGGGRTAAITGGGGGKNKKKKTQFCYDTKK